MSESEAKQVLQQSDWVRTAAGRKAIVLYLHRRAPQAMIRYTDDGMRATLPLSCLSKLPDSERSPKSHKARATWRARKAAA